MVKQVHVVTCNSFNSAWIMDGGKYDVMPFRPFIIAWFNQQYNFIHGGHFKLVCWRISQYLDFSKNVRDLQESRTGTEPA